MDRIGIVYNGNPEFSFQSMIGIDTGGIFEKIIYYYEIQKCTFLRKRQSIKW